MASTEDQRREAAERRAAAMSEQSQPPRLSERSHLPQEIRDGQARRPVMDRYVSCPSSQIRAQTVEKDGKSFFVVEGYATVFDRSYEMWDMFGPYEETVAAGAADETLAAKPDVVFLVNHRGLSLARTGGPWNGNNATLELSSDETGLRDKAWLNPERSEVRDLMAAIGDDVVTEQSFAFRIDEGWWNDDFTQFKIVRFDIDRGDVSAVNYGASPHTSIAARQQEFLADVRLADPATLRGVFAELAAREDLDLDEMFHRFADQRDLVAAVEENAPAEPVTARGRSLTQVAALLEDD